MIISNKKSMPFLTKIGQGNQVAVRGGRCAIGPRESIYASVQITGDRVTRVQDDRVSSSTDSSLCPNIDLSGFLIMPGLINAHDHLEFALYPRLANPHYRNYIEWAKDIHDSFADVIAMHHAVPKAMRLWWGGVRNLLCGATTVSHHNPLWTELQQVDFPVRVVQEYGWGHSLAFCDDLHAARSATAERAAFIVHACEGIDEEARNELWELDRLGVLDESTVIVHGLAIDARGLALMKQRRASLVVCPSSNYFLFGKSPDMSLLGTLDSIALGTDSPLTAKGDLLDEIRFAIHSCNISPRLAYHMVTIGAAAILRLENAEGSIRVGGTGDLIAVRDTGHDPADRLQMLSIADVEFVMIAGCVQLASEAILESLPASTKLGMEPLWVDGMVRWLRAPVKKLLQKTEEVLGKDMVRLGGKPVRLIQDYDYLQKEGTL